MRDWVLDVRPSSFLPIHSLPLYYSPISHYNIFHMRIYAGSFGIGTSLTNDFTSSSSNHIEKSSALNMVIKLHEIDGKPCVKISDEIMKVRIYFVFLPLSLSLLVSFPYFTLCFFCFFLMLMSGIDTDWFPICGEQNTGDPETVKAVKEIYGIPMQA